MEWLRLAQHHAANNVLPHGKDKGNKLSKGAKSTRGGIALAAGSTGRSAEMWEMLQLLSVPVL